MLLLPKAKKKIINWAFAILLPSVFVPTVALCTNFGLSNSFLVPSICFLGGCALVFVIRCGTFDLFSYQFVNFWYSFIRHSPKKYKNLGQYREVHSEKRKLHSAPYLPYLTIGSLLLVLAIIFAFVTI